MNKKLLAIAVGAAMVAGATAATAGDEPTFYGKIHVSIDSMDNGTSSPGDSSGIFVSSNSSRLGIKGAVDLDGGLKAVYKYEMLTEYSEVGLAGNRNAYLGLKSGGHQVVAGRHDMPFKTIGRKADLFGDTIGDTRIITRLSKDNLPGGVTKDDWADRRANVIMYTGKFDAIGVKVAYAPDEAVDDTTDMGIGIDYKGGPLGVSFVNETHGKGNLINTAPNDKASTGNAITASYKMGNMKFLGGYMTIANVDGVDGLDVNAWTLGGSMKSGMNTFKIQYTSGEADCTGCTDTGGTLLALGVDHAFSKKTKVYAVYAQVTNEDNINFQIGDGTGHADTVADSAPGDGGSGFSLGMIHKF